MIIRYLDPGRFRGGRRKGLGFSRLGCGLRAPELELSMRCVVFPLDFCYVIRTAPEVMSKHQCG